MRNPLDIGGSDAREPRGTTAQPRSYIRLNENGPFSDAVMVGNTLYLSGRIGLDSSRRAVPDDIDAEVRNLMEDVRAVLQQAGMCLDDLVYVQVFCPDLSLWEQFNATYSTYFSGKLPARAFVGVRQLLFGAHFELQGIAIKTGGASPQPGQSNAAK
jgi:reactive intermediate/imine deaminase